MLYLASLHIKLIENLKKEIEVDSVCCPCIPHTLFKVGGNFDTPEAEFFSRF